MTSVIVNSPTREGEPAVLSRLRVARVLLVLGALGPYLITVEDAALKYASAGLSPLDVLRGGLPWLTIAIAYFTARPLRRLAWGAPELILVAFLCWAIVSTGWSVGPLPTALKAVTLAATYLNIRMLVGRYESPTEAMSGLAAFVHTLLIWTAIQFLLWPSVVYGNFELYSDVVRLSGKFPTTGSNLLALLAVFGLTLLVLHIGPRWTRTQFMTSVLALIYLGELLMTRTRSATFLGAIVLLVAWVAACRRTPWAVALGSISAAAAGLWVVANQSTVLDFLIRGQSASELPTLTGRTITWNAAVEYWQTSVWLGHGYFAGHRMGLRRYVSNPVSNLDNTWIETLVNLGIVGTVLLALFLTVGAARALRAAESGPVRVWVTCVILYCTLASWLNPSLQDANVAQLVLGWCLLAYARDAVPAASHRAVLSGDPDVQIVSLR